MAVLTVMSYSLCPLTGQIGLWWWVIFNTTTIWRVGERKKYSESEEGGDEGSEDQEQERICILEEVEGARQRDGSTAPRLSPSLVLDLPQEDVMA